MAQRVHRLLQFVLGAFQHDQCILQCCVKLQSRTYARDQHIQLREACGIRFTQHLHAELRRFQQTGGVRQARMVRLQLCPLLRAEIQRLQFAPLEQQQFTLGQHSFGILFELYPAAVQSLPITKQPRHHIRIVNQTAITIQQIALCIRTQQRLMSMLPMNIEQMPTRIAHLL